MKINGTDIKVDTNGLYRLNDLHKASGFGREKRPAEWARYEHAKALINEVSTRGVISRTPQFTVVQGGLRQGTWGNKLIALSYAAWLDVKFHIEVFTVFEQYSTQGYAVNPNITTEQIQQLEGELSVTKLQLAMVQQEVKDVRNEASLNEYPQYQTIHEYRREHGMDQVPWPKGHTIKSVGYRIKRYCDLNKIPYGIKAYGGANKGVHAYHPQVLDIMVKPFFNVLSNTFIIFP